MATAGVDVGTQTVKVVILQNGEIIGRAKVFSGFDPAKSAEEAISEALKMARLKLNDLRHVTTTGSGMELAPHTNSTISMMGADAKAGVRIFPKARTIIDVGAEEARAVKCDERGVMADFVVNERCAAGAGTFIEAMPASTINASCVIFGESDVVTLIHRQESKPEIARAVFDAMADRISSMVRRLGVNPDVVLVGGVAKDVGFVASLKRKLGVDVLIPEYPDFVGAFGAALVAAGRVKEA